jgi:hypothetical protein
MDGSAEVVQERQRLLSGLRGHRRRKSDHRGSDAGVPRPVHRQIICGELGPGEPLGQLGRARGRRRLQLEAALDAELVGGLAGEPHARDSIAVRVVVLGEMDGLRPHQQRPAPELVLRARRQAQDVRREHNRYAVTIEGLVADGESHGRF